MVREAEGKEKAMEPRNKMRRTRSIMVIDDNPLMLQLMKDTLQPEGYDVIVAADGVTGMNLLRNAIPDLVLLDIMMPGPDGYQVLKSIREYSNVPVIMVTGKLGVDSVKEALGLGADDYVKKPFRPGELVARINAKLKRTEQGHDG